MLLSCRQVKKSFGEHLVLNGVDLDICQGDRIGLVGRNGTGKTTLANILTG
ncbi:MAG: ATP-binding cassette domain-containing protein, partial [Heliobacteriaceae bacterium]|nr:ATP-binding cassette domain-containing protein [Heliobacteriaceae bacterium]